MSVLRFAKVAAIPTLAGLAILVWVGWGTSNSATKTAVGQARSENPFLDIPTSALESFGLTVSRSAPTESAELAKDPSVLPIQAAEAAARKSPLASVAALKQPATLSMVEIQHRYGDGASFVGPAWTFQFAVVLPASSNPRSETPGPASLLVTVDARTGELLAVNGFEPRQ